jgi:hypothetical protein
MEVEIGLQRMQAVIARRQRVAAERCNHRFPRIASPAKAGAQ